jgi:1,4-alpha-glucan branching enzyme
MVACFSATFVHSQIMDVTPAFPTTSDVVTITYDASQGNGTLSGVGTVYAHTGVITTSSASPSNWQYVQGAWGTADPEVLMTNIGNNKHQITIDIDVFYNLPANTTVLKLAFVFRNASGSIVGRSADGSDIYYDIYPSNAGFLAKFFSPENHPVCDLGTQINVVGKSNANANLSIIDNGITLQSASNNQLINHTLQVNTPGEHVVELVANNGSTVVIDTFYYTVNPSITYMDPPSGYKLGLNRINDSKILLKLYAPEKEHVYVMGDFNNWQPQLAYHMNLSMDSTTWWIEIDNLQPNTTYGYQYFIDGELKLADPLSERIADPSNDNAISAQTYPNPYPYPIGLTQSFISLFETNPTDIIWQHDNYTRPEKKDLMIYELLVRDFVSARNYQTLIDTLDYLDSLGINAIELMPVGEFENNESWGYNPSFHMALDKYYGTPQKFKEFVDACHGRGIAVIMDIALNHAFGQNPMVNMYWDAANNRPAANNPWFNAICPHAPYCWGYDLNHEVQPTKDYIDRVNLHWINEYHIDGFRFDYTKGFVNSGANYSNTRINLLKRMADTIWAEKPDAYIILEHWADNNEEKLLSDYGMMLWGNLTYEYHQAMKGYNSNFSNGIHTARGWNDPHLITYVESHDEERGMFECLDAGNGSNPAHDVQNLLIALQRAQAAGVTMLLTPGPKMIWQFGELGYDISIEVPCRTCNKPILWGYWNNVYRRQLYQIYQATLKLRNEHPTFNDGTFQYSLTASIKKMVYQHPNMDALLLSNFGVINQNAYAGFPSSGWWYEYYTGDSVQVTDVNMQLSLKPAEYRLYTNVRLQQPVILSTAGQIELSTTPNLQLFPNPASEKLHVTITAESTETDFKWIILDQHGKKVMESGREEKLSHSLEIDIHKLSPGNYAIIIEHGNRVYGEEFIINR